MIGIWLDIEITMECTKSNLLTVGLFYYGRADEIINLILLKKDSIFTFREIFYFNEDSLISARLLTRLPNTVLRIINNDTYDEMPLVFNRLKPALLKKNKVNYIILLRIEKLNLRIVLERLYIFC